MRVGTSGWRYVSWRGDFYPTGLRQREELSHLSRLVTSVEVNGPFYSLQRPERYRSWAAVAPPHFEFAVKGGRYITHLRRLQGVETALANHWASGVLALGPALGPTLWQLPARSAFDEDRLDRFLSLLPRTAGEAAELAHQHDDKVAEGRAQTHLEAGVDPASPVRHALEPRHQSFDDPRARALLDSHGVALVESDSAGTWPRFEALTTDHAYVRLHGEDRLYGAATRRRHWTRGQDVSGAGAPRGSTRTCTSTTTSTAGLRTTQCHCSTAWPTSSDSTTARKGSGWRTERPPGTRDRAGGSGGPRPPSPPAQPLSLVGFWRVPGTRRGHAPMRGYRARSEDG